MAARMRYFEYNGRVAGDDIHNAEPMFGEPRSTIVALPKGAMLRTGSGIPSTWVALMSLSKYGGSGRR